MLHICFLPTGFYSREEIWWPRWKESRRQREEKGEPSVFFVVAVCDFSLYLQLQIPFFSVMLQKASSDSDSESGSGSEKKVVDSDSEDEKPRPALSGSESQSGSKSESDSDPPPRKGPQARKKGVGSILFKIRSINFSFIQNSRFQDFMPFFLLM